ncbi:MAG: hypothetical protein JXD18_12395 [Anaerolineae bacterium]|nr:hypothetical protein [Anaerolineae bacterium]
MKRRLPALLWGVGAAAGIVGAVAPWVPHRAAGLRISAFDLFEVVKYLPGVREGAVPLLREAFLLPLALCAVLLAALPAVMACPGRVARWLFPVVGALIALTAIPPYPQVLTAYRDPEYRGQLVLSVGACLLAGLSPLARRVPRRVVGGLALLAGIAGLVLPLLQFWRVRALVDVLYNAPTGIGWGCIAYVLGLCAVLAAGVRYLSAPDYECQE